MNRYGLLPLGIVLLFGMALANTQTSAPQQDASPKATRMLAYHDHPPVEPLPETMEPSQFKENRAAFVSYSLAAQTKATLYQIPCYCGCNKAHGHESLLDCFVGTHGAVCPLCQKEVLFCYLQQKKRKSPEEMRQSMANGKAQKLDLDKYVKRLYAQIEASRK